MLVDVEQELVEQAVGAFEFQDAVGRQEGRQAFLPVVMTTFDAQGDAMEVERGAQLGERVGVTRAALDYLRLLRNPPVKVHFDIVEVLLQDSAVREIRHLPNTFAMEHPYRYG